MVAQWLPFSVATNCLRTQKKARIFFQIQVNIGITILYSFGVLKQTSGCPLYWFKDSLSSNQPPCWLCGPELPGSFAVLVAKSNQPSKSGYYFNLMGAGLVNLGRCEFFTHDVLPSSLASS